VGSGAPRGKNIKKMIGFSFPTQRKAYLKKDAYEKGHSVQGLCPNRGCKIYVKILTGY
jgi:hypothetical protein